MSGGKGGGKNAWQAKLDAEKKKKEDEAKAKQDATKQKLMGGKQVSESLTGRAGMVRDQLSGRAPAPKITNADAPAVGKLKAPPAELEGLLAAKKQPQGAAPKSPTSTPIVKPAVKAAVPVAGNDGKQNAALEALMKSRTTKQGGGAPAPAAPKLPIAASTQQVAGQRPKNPFGTGGVPQGALKKTATVVDAPPKKVGESSKQPASGGVEKSDLFLKMKAKMDAAEAEAAKSKTGVDKPPKPAGTPPSRRGGGKIDI